MRVATRRLISSHPRLAAACVAQSRRGLFRPSIAAVDAVAFQPCNRFHTSGLSPSRHTSGSSPQYQEDAIEKEEPGHVEVNAQPQPPRSKWRGRQLSIPRLARSLPMHVDTQNGEALQVSWHDNILYVVDESEKGFEFQATQLRDACQCPRCVDASSGQKSFATSQVPTWIKIQHVEQTDVGVVVSTFGDLSHSTEDSHVITLTWEWIRNHFSRGTEPINPRMFQLQRRFGLEHWDADIISRKVRKIDYHEYMKGEDAFWDVVQDLVRLGIVFLKNVPRDENSIVEITTRMANIRETFYGRTFDVRAKPNAENVAYTSGYLGLHQDLLYLQPPPKIQVLHCMDNSCSGGESLFSDADRVGRMMWALRDQAPIKNLTHTNVLYGYEKYGHRYMRARQLLNANTSSTQVYGGVYWSPPFQKPFRGGGRDLKSWIEGAQIFEAMVNEDSATYETKMEPGEAVFFDNMRVLHGRKAFDAAGGGSRWLRGAYISPEDFISRASYAPETHAQPLWARRALWNPNETEAELVATDWYTQLLDRLRRIQTESQAEEHRAVERARSRLQEKGPSFR
ncbi:unnamed protein product [Clonostachys byssicola]|uniref:Gamma-butyrobetaine dioxygenase n=1 Tax=Clonostachys byssicola TaxID=160290 RepID=A0A9N9U4Y4_9HYPO|nr:unnamed protein product [Clonostachys byssicola]